MSARSRRKGAAWEREVVRLLGEWFPDWDLQRGDQSRRGSDAPDVEGKDREGRPIPVWIECKVGQRLDVVGALRQAEEATDGRPVIAAMKRNQLRGQPPEVYFAMRRDLLMDLLIHAVRGGFIL